MIKGKRGENILTENIIFIVLNLIFLTILAVFLISKMGNTAVLEEKYAKEIAMIIDSAKPMMMIELDMQDAIDKKDGGFNPDEIVSINKNVVNVNLREGGKGYPYSFFNDVEIAKPYFNGNKLVLIVDKYNS